MCGWKYICMEVPIQWLLLRPRKDPWIYPLHVSLDLFTLPQPAPFQIFPFSLVLITWILVAIIWDKFFWWRTLQVCCHVPQGLNINVTVGIKREDNSGASHSVPSVASAGWLMCGWWSIASMKDNANCIQSQSILCTNGKSYAFQSFRVSSIPTTSNKRDSM